jgi:hypothetical protein
LEPPVWNVNGNEAPQLMSRKTMPIAAIRVEDAATRGDERTI